MKNLKKLPRVLADVVNYQLTIRAWLSEWSVSYEYKGLIFNDLFAHGETIEEAVNQMLIFYESESAFKSFRD